MVKTTKTAKTTKLTTDGGRMAIPQAPPGRTEAATAQEGTTEVLGRLGLLEVSGHYTWSRRTARPVPVRSAPSSRLTWPQDEIPQSVLDRLQMDGDGNAAEEPQTAEPGAGWAVEESAELAITPWWFHTEDFHLDVDGRYPQMTASGTLRSGLAVRTHWVARLRSAGPNRYWGVIWYRHGNPAGMPHTRVYVRATPHWLAGSRRVTATFFGGGAPTRTVTYRWRSGTHHPVEFEYDTVQGATAVTRINTGDHPNRPASLPLEYLSIAEVYRRAGFDARVSAGNGTIPLAAAGVNGTWSDAEMHDAMRVFWSRFADRPQWAMWVLFAARHDMGPNLGGIMFDDIGPNHRQGTAIFSDSFIANPPPNDPAPAAWVERMRFWTACHEMGHGFNLAHSWQKALGTPWTPLNNENEARSFMNYPYNVAGGQPAFFADFEYRFSDQELLFLRHAPEQFVEPGNADWFDQHGFEQAQIAGQPNFTLEIRANRSRPEFEFLEPVCVELKLRNASGETQILDHNVLSDSGALTFIVKRRGRPARQWIPYSRRTFKPEAMALAPGAALYESLFISAGLNGWDIAEPGIYTVQAVLRIGECDVVSGPFVLRVRTPGTYEEERIAPEVFDDDVGRVLAFDGSRVLTHAVGTLREIADRFPDSRAAVHARVAVESPALKAFKSLDLTRGTGADARVSIADPDPDHVTDVVERVLLDDPDAAADALGNIDFGYYVTQCADLLSKHEETATAVNHLRTLRAAFDRRGVLLTVLDEIDRRIERYSSGEGA